FSSSQKGVVLYVKELGQDEKLLDLSELIKSSTGKQNGYFTLDEITEFKAPSELHYSYGDISSPQPVPQGSTLSLDKELHFQGIPLPYDSLYYKDPERGLVTINPSLFLKKSDGKLQEVTKEDFKSDDHTLLLAVLMLPAIFLLRGIAGFINTYLITYCGQHVLEQIRSQVFRKFQRLDLAYFQSNGTGDLMTRLMVQTTRLGQMLTGVSNDLIKQPVAFLSAMAALIYLSIQNEASIFILISLAIIPICLIPIRSFSKMMIKKMRKGAAGENQLGNCLQENLVGARDIRSFNLEEKEIAKFQTILDKFFKHIMGMTKYKALLPPAVEVITTLGISVAIYYSASYGMTMESVIPLILALYMSYEPLKRIALLQNQLVMGGVAIEMLEGILHAKEKILDPENPKPLPELKGGITFKNVIFKYDTGKPALRQINTVIQPGEVVALVGPSGAGKSTFTHLISRTYEITKGEIFFDHHNVTEHKLSDLRAQVAVVSQDPYLFNDTIKNNILLGKLDATHEEVMLAAERANCLEFIEKLPKGFNTKCGEKATLLSGGQRQRLAIARAFLKDSPILILDEATSALDAESEQTVQAALAKLVKGRTTLIIAHRFSSIQIATRILVFNKGEIVADGDHNELLKISPLYLDLYHKQNI
ncbi:ABC transporter ATP-binding protein/permease, partial [Akkermansiaceae bacterium]|nr:ABC transporter ATP-binding protein/permease [Akkermansiaceae bacterium]